MTSLAQRFILAASLCFSATAASASHADAQQRRLAMPPIRHVFIIVLENQGFDTTFNAHPRAPYLADTLRLAGAFVRQYHGTAHYSLGNYLAMFAGVASTPKTQIDCPRLKDFVEAGIAPDGQPIGDGCVYPAHIATIANQLEAKRLTWGAFMEDMGNDATREAAVT